MNILLDTHVLLWWFLDSSRLNDETRARLADPDVEIFVSSVSAWEIAIKLALGKLDLPGPLAQYLPERIRRAGLTELPIAIKHAIGAESLPMHHTDPFDRLLIAQAQSESLAIVTADPLFAKYDVHRIAA